MRIWGCKDLGLLVIGPDQRPDDRDKNGNLNADEPGEVAIKLLAERVEMLVHSLPKAANLSLYLPISSRKSLMAPRRSPAAFVWSSILPSR